MDFDDDDVDDDPLPSWLEGDSLAPYVATPGTLLRDAFDFAELKSSDVVLDLGSGDGRLPIAAVLCGASRGIGVEIDPELVTRALQNVASRQLQNVEIFTGDLCEPSPVIRSAFDDATLITAYLLPEALGKLDSILRRHLSRKGRLLTLGWPPPDFLVPAKTTTLGETTGAGMDAFYFIGGDGS